MPDADRASALHEQYEPHPDPTVVAPPPAGSSGESLPPKNVSNIDYTPRPEESISVSPVRQRIVQAITSLYSGSKSEEDIQVYARESIYDDPWSYCDTRYKIAGQWWGIPAAFASSRTLKTQIVESKPTSIIFKLQQEWTLRLIHVTHVSNSLVSLTLGFDPDSKEKEGAGDAWKESVKYHKDMWNEKDYSHEGLGKTLKDLNGDYLTGITQPPKWL